MTKSPKDRFGLPLRAALAAAMVFAIAAADAPAEAPRFTSAAPLNTNSFADELSDLAPSIAFGDDGVCVAVWHSYENLHGTIGTDLDILFARSTNSGATWSYPAPLASNAAVDAAPDDYPAIACDVHGNWLAVWSGLVPWVLIGGDQVGVLGARSSDGGATWSSAAPLLPDAGTLLYGDFSPTVASDGAGSLYVAWFFPDPELRGERIDTIREDIVMVARSTDGGATWSPRTATHSTAAAIYQIQLAPSLAAAPDGVVVAAWHTIGIRGVFSGFDNDVYFSRSEDFGATWSVPTPLDVSSIAAMEDEVNPSIATDGAGNWVAAFQAYRVPEGLVGLFPQVQVVRSTDNGITWSEAVPFRPASVVQDSPPSIASDGGGRWFVAWGSGGEAAPGYDPLLWTAFSADNAATWDAPVQLAYRGFDPVIASDRAGTWLAAWVYRLPFMPSFVESDISFARSAAPPGGALLLR